MYLRVYVYASIMHAKAKQSCAYSFWTFLGGETSGLKAKRCPGTSPCTYELRNSGDRYIFWARSDGVSPWRAQRHDLIHHPRSRLPTLARCHALRAEVPRRGVASAPSDPGDSVRCRGEREPVARRAADRRTLRCVPVPPSAVDQRSAGRSDLPGRRSGRLYRPDRGARGRPGGRRGAGVQQGRSGPRLPDYPAEEVKAIGDALLVRVPDPTRGGAASGADRCRLRQPPPCAGDRGRGPHRHHGAAWR